MGRPKGSWRGSANPRFKGGRYTAANGYVFVYRPDHPNADKRGYVREHVLIMSESIGRAIACGEVVHHRNEVRGDNRIDNLELMTRGRHHSHHHRGIRKPASVGNLLPMTSEWSKAIWASGARDHLRKKPRTCDHCGAQFVGNRNVGKIRKHQFCNRSCYQAHRKAKWLASKAT
jgi:hypothetical protein